MLNVGFIILRVDYMPEVCMSPILMGKVGEAWNTSCREICSKQGMEAVNTSRKVIQMNSTLTPLLHAVARVRQIVNKAKKATNVK